MNGAMSTHANPREGLGLGPGLRWLWGSEFWPGENELCKRQHVMNIQRILNWDQAICGVGIERYSDESSVPGSCFDHTGLPLVW